jgi:hypothetical protein
MWLICRRKGFNEQIPTIVSQSHDTKSLELRMSREYRASKSAAGAKGHVKPECIALPHQASGYASTSMD